MPPLPAPPPDLLLADELAFADEATDSAAKLTEATPPGEGERSGDQRDSKAASEEAASEEAASEEAASEEAASEEAASQPSVGALPPGAPVEAPKEVDEEAWPYYRNESELDGQVVNAVTVQVGAATTSRFDAGEHPLQPGQRVLVETDRGLTLGLVTHAPRRELSGGLPRVARLLDPDDSRTSNLAQREKEAYQLCRDRIRDRKLPMKLLSVEYLHSGNKATFFFSAENRVDFRDLVKDLARNLHLRVEMRQVGVRDESRIAAGMGPCGQPLCCSTWIKDFHPVSIRMAKDQNLVLNPTKVSGMCGRLKCCLAYEQALYREARQSLPKVGQRVKTPAGIGRVHEVDIPRRLVRVLGSDGSISTFSADEVQRDVPDKRPPADASPPANS